MLFENVITSSCFGNMIGMISLIIGIVSLVWTVITYRTTIRIEKKIQEEKASAIDKMNFREYKNGAIKALNNRRKAVEKANRITSDVCNEVITTCNKIKGYNNELSQKDKDEIDRLYSKIVILTKNGELNGKEGIISFIEITTGIINILQKGEYEV